MWSNHSLEYHTDYRDGFVLQDGVYCQTTRIMVLCSNVFFQPHWKKNYHRNVFSSINILWWSRSFGFAFTIRKQCLLGKITDLYLIHLSYKKYLRLVTYPSSLTTTAPGKDDKLLKGESRCVDDCNVPELKKINIFGGSLSPPIKNVMYF